MVLTHASSVARMLEPLGTVTSTGDQFISEATVKKQVRVISEHLCMPAT